MNYIIQEATQYTCVLAYFSESEMLELKEAKLLTLTAFH